MVVPNENLNRKKLINMFWVNLNGSQFAFVTKINEDSWRFLILTRRKQRSIWKVKFFYFQTKDNQARLWTCTFWVSVVPTCNSEVSNNWVVLRTRWNILDETFFENSFFFHNMFHFRFLTRFCSIWEVWQGSEYTSE